MRQTLVHETIKIRVHTFAIVSDFFLKLLSNLDMEGVTK
jgi:hypothetical protein